MKKSIVIFIIILSMLNITYANKEDFELGAPAAILIDPRTGQVLYEKDADKEHMYPASTTKIMTAILAIELGNLDSMMTASRSAVYDIGKDGMNIGIMPGEEVCLDDLLDAMLIKSANETANIIAENICSTRQEFIDLMNKRAKELGALNTHFVNPCGAHDDDHYTTVRDMAIIARHAMTLDTFRDKVSQVKFDMAPTNKHDSWPTLYTSNQLLRNPPEEFEIIGIKTGYTGPAGQNLVSAAVNSEGMELISVVFGVKSPTSTASSFTYSHELLSYGFSNFAIQDVAYAGMEVKELQVENAKDDQTVRLITKEGLKSVLPLDKNDWNIEEYEHMFAPVSAPVSSGELMGYIEYKKDGIAIGKVDVIAANSVEAAAEEIIFLEEDNFPMQKIIIPGVIAVISFIILRFLLKQLSRKANSRKSKKYKIKKYKL